MAEIKTKLVIFKENPHIAMINAGDFRDELHVDIDWEADPKRARKYLEKNGASPEALSALPESEPEPGPASLPVVAPPKGEAVPVTEGPFDAPSAKGKKDK